MRYADLSRYETTRLESMLYSYRTLAREHAEAGHFALAKWAHGMVTHITIEMNKRYSAEEAAKDRQQTLDDYVA